MSDGAEADLIAALDGGHIVGAALDVFDEEPLPPEHPYWSHPKILLTPHIATTSLPESAAGFVFDNIQRLNRGGRPSNAVDLSAGY
jgi:glyoxylate/hydroxypyruvate reductase A